MKKILFLGMLFFFRISYSQGTVITGEIRDSNSKETLSYVNIGIPNENIGTVSNENGKFTLKINDGSLDKKITFSHIGYSDKELPVSSLLKGINSIQLESNINSLNEVVIQLKKPKPKKIGRTAKGLGLMHFNFYNYYEKEVDDRLSKEIGMKFKINKNCRIDDLNFNITSNDFKSLKFRINFYSIKEGLPHELLINKDIVFEIRDGFLGWHKVDLKPYDIFIEKEMKDIGVTIQWIESEKKEENSKYFSISTAYSPIDTFYYREKAMDSWKKSDSNLSFYINAMCN